MKAHIEDMALPASVLRIYVDGRSFESRDPYEWSATILWHDSETIEIVGAVKPVTLSVFRAIEDVCRENGIRQMIYDCFTNGECKRHVVDVR